METIRIGPIDFKYVESDIIVSVDGKQLDGKIAYGSGTKIEVVAGTPEQYKRLVLWHEIIHGILYMGGREETEELIDVLAAGVMGVLRDNPELRT